MLDFTFLISTNVLSNSWEITRLSKQEISESSSECRYYGTSLYYSDGIHCPFKLVEGTWISDTGLQSGTWTPKYKMLITLIRLHNTK